MLEQIKFTTREKFILEATSIGIIGAFALSGCAYSLPEQETLDSNAEYTQQDFENEIASLTPASRFDYDYGWNECFLTTPYGPDGTRSFSYNSDSDILTVSIPGGIKPLELTGTKQTETTLQPVDGIDRQIFDAYGCDVRSEDVNQG